MVAQSDMVLNIAATYIGTTVLGPGTRSVVWVQGCPFRCHGCIAPEWIPVRPARLVTVSTLVNELLADPCIDGLTFSGGEPFLQASALACLIRNARKQRELSLICYTGYLLNTLLSSPSNKGILELLSQVDVLIEGPYLQELNDNRGLRGSSNQTIHYLTERHKGEDFHTKLRSMEVIIRDGEVFFVGVPPISVHDRLNQDLTNTKKTFRGFHGSTHAELPFTLKEI